MLVVLHSEQPSWCIPLLPPYKRLQVGTPNHKGLVNKAIQYATRSLVKHAGTRLLLAEILMHLTCEPDKESKARHYSVSMDAVVEGFRLFFINAIELGFMEDNPKLWDCFADLIVQCLETEALSFSDLNFCIPDAFVQQVCYVSNRYPWLQ